MSSLEMVAYINKTREGTGEAELKHYSFMPKVEKVLGKDAKKFLGIYTDNMNRTQQLYNFPKREAMLMAIENGNAWEAAEAALTKAKTVSLIPALKTPLAAWGCLPLTHQVQSVLIG